MKAVDQQKLKRQLAVESQLDESDQVRLELNLSRFSEAFNP
jgi:hypothetical protein